MSGRNKRAQKNGAEEELRLTGTEHQRAEGEVENNGVNSSGEEPREEKELAGVGETTVHLEEYENEMINKMEENEAT